MGYEGRGRGGGAVGSRWGDNVLGYVTPTDSRTGAANTDELASNFVSAVVN